MVAATTGYTVEPFTHNRWLRTSAEKWFQFATINQHSTGSSSNSVRTGSFHGATLLRCRLFPVCHNCKQFHRIDQFVWNNCIVFIRSKVKGAQFPLIILAVRRLRETLIRIPQKICNCTKLTVFATFREHCSRSLDWRCGRTVNASCSIQVDFYCILRECCPLNCLFMLGGESPVNTPVAWSRRGYFINYENTLTSSYK